MENCDHRNKQELCNPVYIQRCENCKKIRYLNKETPMLNEMWSDWKEESLN